MTEKEVLPLSGEDLRKLAEALIHEQSTMTLATTRGGAAWAAPVYYAYSKSVFYFFSDPASRHIQESLESGQASSAIHAFASTWQGIRGIQMSGIIRAVSSPGESLRAIMAYLKKFPFTKTFFSPGQKMDLDGFSKRFKVRLYSFRPDLVYYLDNSIRFGFRENVIL